jgi:hypothetical protein
VIARQEREEPAGTAAMGPATTGGAVDLDARRQVELLTAEVSALRAELVAQRSPSAD